MSPRKPRPTPTTSPVLQDTAGRASFDSDLDWLYFHAEMRFQQHGGSKCAICRAHVRHVVEVTSFRPDGKKDFPCLCMRCLVAEEARASRVVLRLDGIAAESHRPAAARRAA